MTVCHRPAPANPTDTGHWTDGRFNHNVRNYAFVQRQITTTDWTATIDRLLLLYLADETFGSWSRDRILKILVLNTALVLVLMSEDAVLALVLVLMPEVLVLMSEP